MTGYEAKITYTSKELTAKERIQLKDTGNAVRLDEATRDGSILIDPDFYAILDVHNEKAKDNKDYTQLLIMDKDGTKYVTGSQAFMDSFQSICAEMSEYGEGEPFQISVYRIPSKNYSGKDFLSCSIV